MKKNLFVRGGISAVVASALAFVPTLLAATPEAAPASSQSLLFLICTSSACFNNGGGINHCVCLGGVAGTTCTSNFGIHCGLPADLPDCADTNGRNC